jgi:SAM-dependent methyltransferase
MNTQPPTATPTQPTDPNLVWERRSNARGRKFEARAVIVQQLISRWTEPDFEAVDVSGGPGRWLDTLAPHFKRFSHLDLSSAAIEVARREHPHLCNVDYGLLDLLHPEQPMQTIGQQTWDVAFCLDTLLYRGVFVEAAVATIHKILRPGGVAIFDFPTAFRASISRTIKGPLYKGPERTFSPQEARDIVSDAGFTVVDCAYHFAELTGAMHAMIGSSNTRLAPLPSTWTYLVLTK